MGIIEFIVVFIAMYLLFQFGRWFILPHMKVGVFSFPGMDGVAFRAAYGVSQAVATAIFHWILAILFCIYVIWMIIKTFVPEVIIFFPVRSMLLALPPFPQLTDAGILPLIDDIVHILIGGGSPITMVKRLIIACLNFFSRSSGYIMSIFNIFRWKPPVVQTAPQQATSQPEPTTDDGSGDASDQDNQDKLSPAEQVIVQNEYLKCIEKHTQPVPSDGGGMSIFNTASAIVKNYSSNMQCQLGALQTYSDILSLKM
jgi:hypothetical protein